MIQTIILVVSCYKNQKQVAYFQEIMTQDKQERNWAKAKLRPSRENTGTHISISSIGVCDGGLALKRMGDTTPMASPVPAHMASLLGLLPTTFFCKGPIFLCLQLSEISTETLASLLQIYTAHSQKLQGLQPCNTLPGLLGLSLKFESKLAQPHNTCILYVCKTNITWTPPMPSINASSSQIPLDQGCAIINKSIKIFCM